jgi:hypothetical protein
MCDSGVHVEPGWCFCQESRSILDSSERKETVECPKFYVEIGISKRSEVSERLQWKCMGGCGEIMHGGVREGYWSRLLNHGA